MSVSYSELHKGKLFLANRCEVEVKDIFEYINQTEEEEVLYEYFKSSVYTTKNDKHYRLNISKYMKDTYLHVDKSQNEELEFIVSKLKSVVEFIELKNNDSDRWRLRQISNLIEYIELEQLRIGEQNRYYQTNLENKQNLDTRISEIDSKSNEVIENLNQHKLDIAQNIDGKVEDINKELEESKKSIYKEILSIVGIFTAISFGAFGGISILNNLFGQVGVSNVNLSDIIILGCITAICILTLLYMFIVYLSRMTKLNISIDGTPEKFFRDHKILVCAYAFLICILITVAIVSLINNHRETWELFIEFINSWLRNQIRNLS